MSELGERVECLMEAVNYCHCWNYPATDLDLTHEEFNDLLKERSVASLFFRGHGTSPLKLWGVDVKAEKFPKRSMLRTQYLQLINPSPWIDELALRMERYS